MSVLLQFLLPLLTSIYVYSKIVRTLNLRSRLRLKNTKSQAKREQEMSRNKRRTFLLLSMIAGIEEEKLLMRQTLITGFITSWLPINLFNILEDIGYPLHCWQYYYFAFFCSHCFAMASTVYNPLLYGISIG